MQPYFDVTGLEFGRERKIVYHGLTFARSHFDRVEVIQKLRVLSCRCLWRTQFALYEIIPGAI